MAFFSGSAIDMAAVRTALVDACVSDGWSWNSGTDVLSKGALFLRLQVAGGYLTLLGRTGASSGDAPNVVRLGAVGSTPITYPLSYQVFVFESEIYMVVNYSVDYYQWCAFGKSTVEGLPGTGMWLGASNAQETWSGDAITINTQGTADAFRFSTALFWNALNMATTPNGRNCWVESGLDGQGWWLAQTLAGEPVGIRAVAPLLDLLPNSWNSEAILLPIRAYKARPSSKISLTADLEHARYTRVDNYSPGEVITIGGDRWKIFPWYRKNSAARNGGSAINHTGTFGWAIRYDGP